MLNSPLFEPVPCDCWHCYLSGVQSWLCESFIRGQRMTALHRRSDVEGDEGGKERRKMCQGVSSCAWGCVQ